MDAHEELLLSERVCNQLGIVNYHTDVHPGSSEVTSGPEQAAAATAPATTGTEIQAQSPAMVPLIRVQLLKTVTVPPGQTTVLDVKLATLPGTPALIEWSKALHEKLGFTVEDALGVPDTEGVAKMTVWNPSGLYQALEQGAEVGVLCPDYTVENTCFVATDNPEVNSGINFVDTQSRQEEWSELLLQQVPEPELALSEKEQILTLVKHYHASFSLEAGERGESDILEMKVNTGDT